MKKLKIRKKKDEKKVFKKKEHKKFWNWFISLVLIGGIAFVSLILVFALYVIITSPDFDKDKLYSKEATVIYYKDGTELTRLGSENRVLVNYDELPQVLIDAIIATEDSRFFQHSGLDVARFIKATIGQILGKPGAGGASTLTMQIVKKAYTDPNGEYDSGLEGLIRKATDIYMAVFKVESNYTKEEIIEFYVNTMWFYGGTTNYEGTFGVEQACQYFFGKSVSDINLAEASIIAGMFQNPASMNPYTKPTAVRKRQTSVLNYMVMHGYITEEEKQDVLAIPISSLLRDRSKEVSNINQAVVDFIKKEVEEKTGYSPYNVPMKIYTTIDPNVQDILTKFERGELTDSKGKLLNFFPNEKMQEGVAITNVKDGSVVAISAGRNYQAGGNERATEIKRQPGSTAKILFDYGPAIEYLHWSPSTILLDEPTTYTNGTAIKNSDGKYMGEITMRTALVNSRNIPALRAFKAVMNYDDKIISNFVHSLGIDYGPNLFEAASIGGFDGVTPLQMSSAYAAYARGGYYIAPYVYTKIELIETGQTIDYKYEQTRVMSAETAYMITDMLMSATNSNVSGLKLNNTDIASKGGTTNIDAASANALGVPTNATRDAWNITYSPEYAIALWLGYDKTTSEYYLTSKVGTSIRKDIMKELGTKIYTQGLKFNQPTDVVTVEVEDGTFPTQLASEFTPNDLRKFESFKAGTEPTEVSSRFAKLKSPTNGTYTFNGSQITLSWSPIPMPDAINNTYLQEFFNKNYLEYATKYYEERLKYNQNYIGTIGYNIYQKNSTGTLTYLGRTDKNTFTLNNSALGTYVIKSAYSIFTANMSDGLEITIKALDNNVDNMLDTNNNSDTEKPSDDKLD